MLCSHAHLLNHVPKEHSVINISQGRTFLFVPYHHIIIQPILSHKVNSTMIAVLLQCINFDPNKIPLGIDEKKQKQNIPNGILLGSKLMHCNNTAIMVKLTL